MSYRKLRVFLDWLPEDSLTWTQVRESMTPADRAVAESKAKTHGRWSRTDHLLATIDYSIRVGNWQYISSVAKPGQAGPVPKPIERPGINNVVPISDEAADFMDRYFARIRANHGATGEGA